jgi:cbb3-type cytochrome oxidase subunit 3
MLWRIRSLLLILVVGTFGGALVASASENPSITAQGFAMNTTLSAAAGEFERAGVRIEAPERIAKLLISQDGFETELAMTPNRDLFALFGLDDRPLNAFDITLDCAPYMNSRFREPGSYRIYIVVIYRKGGRSEASLSAAVIGEDDDEAERAEDVIRSPGLDESAAVFRREGSGGVDSDGVPGLEWITIEPINVTIRLRAVAPNATLHQLSASSWSAVTTQEHLTSALAQTPSLDYVDLRTARGQAANTIIALVDDGGNTLIHLTGSTTSVSSAGTTVTLTASVRR